MPVRAGIAFLFLACLPARAQTGALPFGLQEIHWGMTPVQAQPHYVGYGGRHALPADWFSGRPEFVGPYSWNGCRLSAYFYFEGAGGALDSVMLRVPAEATNACLAAMQAELVKNFGAPKTLMGKPIALDGSTPLRTGMFWPSAEAKRCRDVALDSGLCGDRLATMLAKREQDANIGFFKDRGQVMLWAPGMPRHYLP